MVQWTMLKLQCYNVKISPAPYFFLVKRANEQERDQLDVFNRLIEKWTKHDEPTIIQSLAIANHSEPIANHASATSKLLSTGSCSADEND